MSKIIKVKALNNYKLYCEFSDGLKGEIDMSDRLFGPVFEPLKNELNFQKVFIDEFGVICWENGADLAPDAVYAQLSSLNQKA